MLFKDYKMRSAFGFRYATGYEKTVEGLIRESLDSAIAEGCQVLVFPELVISPRLSEKIGRLLRDAERRGRLSLVVAGSGWQEFDGEGDNICHLYDGFGRHLGTYHKCSAFLPSNKEGEDYEALANPALTCTMVDVRGLGRVLPSICKDLGSNERYTSRLATTFESDLVCVPALSTSLEKVFDDQMHTLANRAYSHCVVCNVCGARHEYLGQEGQDLREDGVLAVALVGHPVPSSDNPNNVDCEHIRITRSRSCHNRCVCDCANRRMHSCLHVVEISSDHSGSGTTLSIVEPSHKQ